MPSLPLSLSLADEMGFFQDLFFFLSFLFSLFFSLFLVVFFSYR